MQFCKMSIYLHMCLFVLRKSVVGMIAAPVEVRFCLATFKFSPTEVLAIVPVTTFVAVLAQFEAPEAALVGVIRSVVWPARAVSVNQTLPSNDEI